MGLPDTSLITPICPSLQLKEILAERGLECKGCAEKADVVKLVKESYHLPIKEKEIPPPPRTSGSGLPPDGTKLKDDELEELMKNLGKAPGMENMGFNMFRADDFKGPDGKVDAAKMEEMMKGKGGRSYRTGKKPQSEKQKQDL